MTFFMILPVLSATNVSTFLLRVNS